jgi:hypothetical protein
MAIATPRAEIRRTGAEIQQDVMAELQWDPRIAF